MSTAKRVWEAMARREVAHGGPCVLTTNDIWDLLTPRVTTPTIGRALRELEYIGIVTRRPERPSGFYLWTLDAPGRAKYGLPNTHSSDLPIFRASGTVGFRWGPGAEA